LRACGIGSGQLGHRPQVVLSRRAESMDDDETAGRKADFGTRNLGVSTPQTLLHQSLAILLRAERWNGKGVGRGWPNAGGRARSYQHAVPIEGSSLLFIPN